MKRILLVLLFLLALWFRLYGLSDSHPFWVDEFSTANQARLFLNYGGSIFTKPDINFELNNILTHVLVAGSFRIFGESEYNARLPFAIIGSLIPVLMYLLSRRLFSSSKHVPAALAASLLGITSYFQITWSRQARGYVLLELIILCSMYMYIKITTSELIRKRDLVYLFGLFLLGILTHFTFYLFIASLSIHFVVMNIGQMNALLRNKYTYIVGILAGLLLYTMRIQELVKGVLSGGLIEANNVWYYHSFLWREYGIISFLATLGLIVALKKSSKIHSAIALFMAIHTIFYCFFFPPYTSRYMLLLFPFLFIYGAYAIEIIAKKAGSRAFWTLIFTGLIILNGFKFDIKPNRFYSVNHDFREIALIDYNQMYSVIKSKGKLQEGKTAVIDTWHDRLFWYMGTDFKSGYLFRWGGNSGSTNGLARTTSFFVDPSGDKRLPRIQNIILITDLSDLKKAMKKYERGFIIIDDTTMSADVIQYAIKNFKKELYLDHYPLDDNPSSIWPVTLYSWGI